MSARFSNRVLVLGAGSVSQSVLPLLIEHLVDAKQITIMDQRDNRARVQDALSKGATYIQDVITRENIDAQLSKYLSAGDFLLDLAWNIDANVILHWCHDHGVMYLNTSIEEWDPYEGGSNKNPLDRTLYYRHMRMREMKAKWTKTGATAIVEHGANPGLVSHLVKKSLVDIATRALKDGKAVNGVEAALTDENYNSLSHLLGVKVIHIAERDTQVTNRPKQWGEFVNTWSVEGFYEEGVAPAELGWGTHEKWMPANAHTHETGCGAAIYLMQPGANTRVRTWCPTRGAQYGFLVTHNESISISDYFTVRDTSGKAIYRPTCHYAYHPADDAVVSLHEMFGSGKIQEKHHILEEDEIVDGIDELGVLLYGHKKNAYWYGSRLSIEETRKLAPYQNATGLQVTSAVLAGMVWAIENPNAGIVEADDLDFRRCLEVQMPYLGPVEGHYTDWTPLSGRPGLFPEDIDTSDPWQFRNVLVR
mgnify:CR=1 FL=1